MLHFQESTFLLEQKVDYFYWIGVVMAKVDDNFVCTLILANFFDLRCINIFAVCRHFVCVCVFVCSCSLNLELTQVVAFFFSFSIDI